MIWGFCEEKIQIRKKIKNVFLRCSELGSNSINLPGPKTKLKTLPQNLIDFFFGDTYLGRLAVATCKIVLQPAGRKRGRRPKEK